MIEGHKERISLYFFFYQILKMVAAIQPINVKLRLSNFSRFNIVFDYILLILGAFLWEKKIWFFDKWY